MCQVFLQENLTFRSGTRPKERRKTVFSGRRDLRGRTEPRTHIAEVPTPAIGGNGRPAAEQRPEAPVPRHRVRRRLNVGVGGYTPVASPASHSERSQAPAIRRVRFWHCCGTCSATNGTRAAGTTTHALLSHCINVERSRSARIRRTQQSMIRSPTKQDSN